MEVSAQSSLGVRTRARTLALQRLQKPSPPDSSSYLELRSRRLEKPPPPAPKEDTAKPNNPSHRTGAREANSGSVGSVSLRSCPNSNSKKGSAAPPVEVPEASLDAEVSFGENVLEVEARDRWVRLSSFLSKLGFFRVSGLSRVSACWPVAGDEFFFKVDIFCQEIFFFLFLFLIIGEKFSYHRNGSVLCSSHFYYPLFLEFLAFRVL